LKKKKKGEAVDLRMDEVVPRPLVKSEISSEGQVILLKPKFRNPWLRRHLEPRMRHPYYRITLDEIGTAFWQLMDGQTDALKIAQKMEVELGGKIHPTYERLGLFLRMLKNSNFIDW